MTPVTIDPFYVPPDPSVEIEVEPTEASERRDRIRLLIGDTDEDELLLSDEELDTLLNQRAVTENSTTTYNEPAAAADAAGVISAKYAREFDFSEDGQQFARAQRVGHYQALERTLRARAGGKSVPLRLAGTETT